MTSSYDDIYSCFLNNIADSDLAKYGEGDAKELMQGWLKSVYARPNVRRLFSSITLDEDMEEMTYELSHSFDEAYDVEFVNELFGLGMAVKWYLPKVDTTLYTNQFFGTKEQKWFAQGNQQTALADRLKYLEKEFDRKASNHGYSHFAVNGV